VRLQQSNDQNRIISLQQQLKNKISILLFHCSRMYPCDLFFLCERQNDNPTLRLTSLLSRNWNDACAEFLFLVFARIPRLRFGNASSSVIRSIDLLTDNPCMSFRSVRKSQGKMKSMPCYSRHPQR